MASKKFMKSVYESKIINSVVHFNENVILCIFDSRTYRFITGLGAFFKKSVLDHAGSSGIIKSARRIKKAIEARDIGLFVVLAVSFNTLAMAVLHRRIDIFSAFIRILFFLSGVILIFKKAFTKGLWKKSGS